MLELIQYEKVNGVSRPPIVKYDGRVGTCLFKQHHIDTTAEWLEEVMKNERVYVETFGRLGKYALILEDTHFDVPLNDLHKKVWVKDLIRSGEPFALRRVKGGMVRVYPTTYVRESRMEAELDRGLFGGGTITKLKKYYTSQFI